ncbi:MAG: polysulfide reductase [Campylobacteraceae bacterium 4484_4]|nr:MAG: polysulfide reductase [Campylobacteraceae bacterium 4484_4]
MVEHTSAINHAIVTLDVALPGIVWGWMITLNLWAKSIATGSVLVGGYLLARYNEESLKGLKNILPVVAFIFLNIFLLFTLLDLHQPFRMINIFLHPHFTSAITVGAWMATVLTGIIALMAYLVIIKKETRGLYDTLLKGAVILAIPVTLYTAAIMGEATARELWQTPAELIQMALAAMVAGASVLAFFSGSWSAESRRDLAIILATAAFLSFIMYMGEYYLSFKSEEAEATLAYVQTGGQYHSLFWLGQVLGYILPFFISISAIRNGNGALLKLAAILALIGLYIAKHVWLIIPQLLPLS